jgi:protein-S-isoprenylcysteine O-methyltransferase Ste14
MEIEIRLAPMDSELFFRLTFAVLVIAVLGIRLYGHLKAGTFHEPRHSYDEGWLTRAMRPFPVFVGIASVLYIAAPHLMAWSTVDLPDWMRFASLPLGLLVIAGMAWVHRSLSKNFSGKLEIRDDHTLVTSGPYRWVRHPMYTAVIALFLAVFLLTANWFIGFGGLLTVGSVILARTPKEEAMLVETFGDAYREYMRRTPRYIPRV